MGIQYDRRATVTIGRPGATGKEYSGLSVNFEIVKTSDSKPNPGKIVIMNLNQDSRGFLEAKDLTVVLKAGYGDVLPTVFSGDILKAKSDRQGKDFSTLIECGDGEKTIKETKINKNFNPGITTEEIITEVASSFDAAVGTIKGLVPDKFQNGVSFSGSASKVMDGLTEKNGLEWSVQDGTIQVLPPLEPTSDTIGLLISPETGLIGTPGKREEKDAAKNEGVGGFGIEFVTLLAPALLPGVRVQVRSKDFDGIFKVRKVTHKGDTMKGPWESHVEGVAI